MIIRSMITEEETEARSLSVNLQASQNNSQEARETQGLEKHSVSGWDRIRSSLVDICLPGCMRNKERVRRPTASFHPSVEVPVDKAPHQKQREVASNPGESR